MSPHTKLYNLSHRIAKGMLMLAIAAILAIAALGSADTVLSVVAGRPLPAVFEFTQLFIAVTIFAAQPYIVLTGAHIAVDLFKFDGRPIVQTIRGFTILGLSLLSYGVIAIGAWRSMKKSLDLRELSDGIIGIPVYPFKIGLFVGVCVTVLTIVLMLFMRRDEMNPAQAVGEL